MADIELYNKDFRDSKDGILQYKDREDCYVVTDPPYNIGFKYNQYEDNLPDGEYIQLIHSLSPFKLAIIHYPEETMKYFIPALGVPDEVNVWAYNSNLPNRQSRLISYYGCQPNYNNVLQPYKNPNDKRIKERIKSGKLGARSYDWFTDIQMVKNVGKQKYNHPCPVPVALMERIIKFISKPGDTIIDTFMGSGTTGIACINTGRKFIGYEIDKKYFRMAEDRIDEALSEKDELCYG